VKGQQTHKKQRSTHDRTETGRKKGKVRKSKAKKELKMNPISTRKAKNFWSLHPLRKGKTKRQNPGPVFTGGKGPLGGKPRESQRNKNKKKKRKKHGKNQDTRGRQQTFRWTYTRQHQKLKRKSLPKEPPLKQKGEVNGRDRRDGGTPKGKLKGTKKNPPEKNTLQ